MYHDGCIPYCAELRDHCAAVITTVLPLCHFEGRRLDMKCLDAASESEFAVASERSVSAMMFS